MKNNVFILLFLIMFSSCSILYKKNRTFEGTSSSVVVEKIINETEVTENKEVKSEEKTETKSKKKSVLVKPIDNTKPAKIKKTENGLELENAEVKFDTEDLFITNQKKIDSLINSYLKNKKQEDRQLDEKSTINEKVDTESKNSLINWNLVVLIALLTAALITAAYVYLKKR